MIEPCMSCGEDRRVVAPERCLHKANHFGSWLYEAEGEPLYDLDTGKWDKRCPCVRAEQLDPDCTWHGREAS